MELTIGLAIAPAICLPVLAVTAGLKAFIVGGILTLGMWAGAILVTRHVRSAVRVAGCVPDNPVMRYIYQGRADELSRVDYAFQIQDRELNSVAGRLADSVYHLGSLLEESILSIRGTLDAANKQTEKVEYVERAVEQMSTGQGEVGRVSSELAVRSMESRQRTESGQTSVEQLMGAISGLATELKGIYALVQETAERSQSIGAVLDVITEVAEQTNLLALNAAIEAARAGDAGRGFAVVADEVRKLAHRTNESAGEIQQIIESLQSDSHKSSSAIQAGVERSEQTMSIASKVGTELEQVMVQVRGISELALEIDASLTSSPA